MAGFTYLTGEEKAEAELLMDDCLERSQSVEIDIKGLRANQALHCVRPSIVKALKAKGLTGFACFIVFFLVGCVFCGFVIFCILSIL